jgi:ribosomal protein S12 methylthiotransferase
MPESVHIISLGCPKNRVDSEVMLGQIREGDFTITDNADTADVIVVNTCSFIQPATEESIETVLEMAQKKANAQCKKLIVTGCMVQRYGRSLEDELPEVDFFLGTGEYHRIGEILKNRKQDQLIERSFIDTPLYIHDEFSDRLPSWKTHSAYLKISEGCNHRCAFCIIPTLRGKLRSRTIPSLISEAKKLAANGVVELNLVSQDSTAYGRDLGDETDLGTLLRQLTTIDGIEWIRLHYAYPIGLPESLLQAISEEEKICSYIDIPLQHASGQMLRKMRRGVTRSGQERILDRIHSFIPDVNLRTTFIVGFPGETEQDFDILCDFVKQQQFDHVGVFTYHPEDGTAAATMDNQVSDDIKEYRRKHLMSIQAGISKAKLERFLGEEVLVLVDGPSKDHPFVQVGRMATQAPDVDGVVYIDGSDDTILSGQFYTVRITQVTEHDLVGELVGR